VIPPTITAADLAPPLALDPDLDALLAYAFTLELACKAKGFTFEQGMAMFLAWARQLREQTQRVHTGYMPEEQRRAVRHRAYCDGLMTPPKRQTADDLARVEAVKWGLAS
jgi:hypothetical protein